MPATLINEKNILSILQCLEEWTKIVIEGKPLVQKILAEIKTSENKSGHTENLQYLCGQLKDISYKFHPLLSKLELLLQKIHSSFCLANFSASFNESLNLESSSLKKEEDNFPQEDIEYFAAIILQKLQEQFQLMLAVAENIGVQTELDKAIFLACIWTIQPKLDDEYFNANNYLTSIKLNNIPVKLM